MSVDSLFARLMPEFARQATSVDENARRHADAEKVLAKAEYEFFDLQRELQVAPTCRCATARSRSRRALPCRPARREEKGVLVPFFWFFPGHVAERARVRSTGRLAAA